MSIMDKKLRFCAAQALGAVGTTYSDVIDLGVERDVGPGRSLEIFMRLVETAAASGGAATCQFQLQTATDEVFTSPVVLQSTPAIAKASLVAGYEPARWRIPSPTNRYLRIAIIAATNDFESGKVSADVVLDRDVQRAYPGGYTVAA